MSKYQKRWQIQNLEAPTNLKLTNQNTSLMDNKSPRGNFDQLTYGKMIGVSPQHHMDSMTRLSSLKKQNKYLKKN